MGERQFHGKTLFFPEPQSLLIQEEFKKFGKVVFQKLATGFILAPQLLFTRGTQEDLEVQHLVRRWDSPRAPGLKPHLLACCPDLKPLPVPKSPSLPSLCSILYKNILSLLDLITLSQSCTICSFKLASSFKTCELLTQQDNYLSLLLAYIPSFLFSLYSASLGRNPFLTRSHLSNQRYNGQGP